VTISSYRATTSVSTAQRQDCFQTRRDTAHRPLRRVAVKVVYKATIRSESLGLDVKSVGRITS